MSHALIIEDNRAIGRGIERRLEAFGFDSFDHTWSERQAMEAAARHSPDLIVVGDSLAGASPFQVGRKVALQSHAPLLAVTAGRCTLRKAMPADASVEGPFRLSDLDTALAAAGIFA